MGNKWTVEVWTLKEGDGYSGYHYKEFWRGQSFIGALWNLIKAKRKGYGCVTLYWR